MVVSGLQAGLSHADSLLSVERRVGSWTFSLHETAKKSTSIESDMNYGALACATFPSIHRLMLSKTRCRGEFRRKQGQAMIDEFCPSIRLAIGEGLLRRLKEIPPGNQDAQEANQVF